MKKDHRGISLGTYVMLGVTGAVLLGCFLILPGLLALFDRWAIHKN